MEINGRQLAELLADFSRPSESEPRMSHGPPDNPAEPLRPELLDDLGC
jgi:hypothetical protein